jgi:predicted amidohydrolase
MVANYEEIKIGAAQIASTIFNKEMNLSKMEEYIEKAIKKDIQLIVFPECSLTGYVFSNREEVKEVSEPIPGPSTQKIENICKSFECWTVFGLVEIEKGKYYNTSVLIGPKGILGKYQKTHIPCMGLDRFSTEGMTPLRPNDTELGNIALTICYDILFPEPSRVLSLLGAELLVVSTNWPEGVEFFPDHIIRTRAIENYINIISVNRVGKERGFVFFGRSQIVNYHGTVLAEAGKDEELISAKVNMIEPRIKRKVRIPGQWEADLIRDRRPGLYQILCRTFSNTSKK